MAERRMLTKKIVESDAFTELPPATQALYFHLCMMADDDGFNSQTRLAMFNAHAERKDLEALNDAGFIISFEDGVTVIKHWRMHNTLSVSRYKETAYLEHKAKLKIKDNNAYSLTSGTPINDAKLVEMGKRQTQDAQKTNNRRTKDEQKTNTDKNSIDKNRLDENSIDDEEKRKRFSPPTLEEVQAYCIERGNNVDAQHFVDHYTSNGWLVGKNKMRDWKAAVRTWEKNNYGSTKKTAYDNNDDLAAWASTPESEVW